LKVLVPLGTRPEIVKLAPVVRALRERGISVRIVATGQHYDPSLTDTFFEDLGLVPDDRWSLPADEAARVGAILTRAWGELAANRPDLVLVLGDTYTVPLFCMAARRHRVPVAHVEAGLRSFNETSMEEVDRKIAAATCALHFAPTDMAARFLTAEGVPAARVRVVGNPVIDVLRERGVVACEPDERDHVLVTAHRSTNVDDPERLEALVSLVARLADEVAPVTFPVHPRTRDRLEAAGALDRLASPRIRLLPPVPYDEMLNLLAHARVAVTDSGGLQEEASWLGVPVVVLRRSTPRWEGVVSGGSVLVGLDVELALAEARRLTSPGEQRRIAALPCPYGDGHSAKRIAETLADPEVAPLLAIEEPDYVGKEAPG